MRRRVLPAFLLLAAGSAAFAQTPVVADGGVLNAASYDRSLPVAPGSLAAIFGSDLASGIAQADSIPLSTSLEKGGVRSVTFNGVAAPLVFAAPQQINAQIPWEVAPGSVQVVVNRTSGSSAPKTIQVRPASPGLFTASGNGLGQAIAVNNADSTLAAPAGSIPGLTTHPAAAGDVLIVYGNGFGPVDKPAKTGDVTGSVLTQTNEKPVVKIGGVEAQVLFSGMAPQFVGVNQLNIVVPPGVRPGDAVPLQVTIGGITTSDSVTIAIR